jgi:hypothetical protein
VFFVVTAADLAPWHPGRCAKVTLADGTLLGYAGELHPKALSRLGLPARTCAAEISVEVLTAASEEPTRLRAFSTQPVALTDVALTVAESVAAGELQAVLREAAGEFLESVILRRLTRRAGRGRQEVDGFPLGSAPDRPSRPTRSPVPRAVAAAAAVRLSSADDPLSAAGEVRDSSALALPPVQITATRSGWLVALLPGGAAAPALGQSVGRWANTRAASLISASSTMMKSASPAPITDWGSSNPRPVASPLWRVRHGAVSIWPACQERYAAGAALDWTPTMRQSGASRSRTMQHLRRRCRTRWDIDPEVRAGDASR